MTTSRAEGIGADVFAIAATLPVWTCTTRKVTAHGTRHRPPVACVRGYAVSYATEL
jgi:hypothetical protein